MKSVVLIFVLALAAFSQSAPLTSRNDYPLKADQMYVEGAAMHFHGSVSLTMPFGIIQAEDAVLDLKTRTITLQGDSRIDLR